MTVRVVVTTVSRLRRQSAIAPQPPVVVVRLGGLAWRARVVPPDRGAPGLRAGALRVRARHLAQPQTLRTCPG
ncbi:hypothetical protein GCM10009710_25050 [Aeromicrobium alkaliterrae]|uniref:Uncharacterized protein n=1 Tax=Aeromicrobium alkaliterrae TaxID=302168 RepID=A0ABN2K0M9_9ACTN